MDKKAYLIVHMKFDKETNMLQFNRLGIYSSPYVTQDMREILCIVLEGLGETYQEATQWILDYVSSTAKTIPAWKFISDELEENK